MAYQLSNCFRFSGSTFQCVKNKNLLLLVSMVFLCACTTTVKSHHGNLKGLQALNEAAMGQGNESRLVNLPAEVLIQKGNAYLAKNDKQLARLHFAMALKKDQDSAVALTGLAKTFEFKDAQETYELALGKDPNYLPALVALGRLYREGGDTPKSLDHLIRAMNINDQDPEILTELAITYDAAGQKDLAEPLYLEIVNIKPNLAASQNNLGFHYLLQNEHEKAIPPLTRALRLEPENKRFINNLATAYALRGDTENALLIYQSAMDKAGAYNNLGYVYMTQDKWEMAEKAFKRALELKPVFYVRAQRNLDRLNSLRSKAHQN